MTRRVAGAVAVAAAAVTAAGAAAAVQPILLPSIRTPLVPGPPLTGAPGATAEVRFPPGVISTEDVHVGVDPEGKPVSVVVTQRLLLRGLGDYTFSVPAPVADVAAGPGSQSEPGLRTDAILWAGFAARRKVLSARATMRLAPAAELLPLRLRVEREGSTLVVRMENVTAVDAPLLRGRVDVGQTADALDATRRALRDGRAAPDLYVDAPATPKSRTERVSAPLEIRGTVGGVAFTRTLGDVRPDAFEVRVRNAPRDAKLRIVVVPVAPARMLTPPGGAGTWTEAVRRGAVDASTFLERASRIRLTIARALQYAQFLTNPDPRGTSTARYVYVTSAAPPPPPSPTRDGEGFDWTLVYLALAVAGLAAGAVLWAHN
jgi:hypothetical protein